MGSLFVNVPFINQMPSRLLHLLYSVGTAGSFPCRRLIQMIHVEYPTVTVHSSFPD